jgi:hypothetical protein
MTGNSDLITDLHPHDISYITFGDGAKGEIKGIGKLECSGTPKLDNILLVKGLNSNLISISQLCDQGLDVIFTKTECLIINKDSEVIMEGIRTKNNCYMWSSQMDDPSKMSTVARRTFKGNEKCQTRMLHQKLRPNFKEEKVMMAQTSEKRKHMTGCMQSEVSESFVGTGTQGAIEIESISDESNNSQPGWMKLLIII